MPVRFRCKCTARLSAPDQYAGRQIKCPKCESVITVPDVPTAELIEEETFAPPGGVTFPHSSPIGRVNWQRPSRPPLKSGNRKSSPLLLGLIAAVLAVVAVGGYGAYYWWELSESRESVTVTSNLPATRVRPAPAIPASGPLEIPPSTTNRFDSGEPFTASVSNGADSELSTAELIAAVKPSIVLLKVRSIDGRESIGSGFFVGECGQIVTNYHVIQGAETVSVETADGLTADSHGYVVADPERDLAVIQVDPAELDCRPIAVSFDQVIEGEPVAAFGSPRGFKFTTTDGIVSSVRTGTEISGILKTSSGVDIYKIMGYSTETDWIQTSAAISGGNSGGPLVNMQGEMIGVNTWKHPDAENVNFATAASEVQSVFDNREREIHSFRKLPARVTPGFGG